MSGRGSNLQAASQAPTAVKLMLTLEEMGRVGWNGLSEMLRTQHLRTANQAAQTQEASTDVRQQQEYLQVR